MVSHVYIGYDSTIHSGSNLDGGSTDSGGVQAGNAMTDYDLSSNRAEAACQAGGIGLGKWAWSRVWSKIHVHGGSGETSMDADFEISGHYKGQHNAFVGASSSLDVKIFVRDLDADYEMNDSGVMHSDAYVAAVLTKEDDFTKTVNSSDDLVAGKEYAIGARAKVNAAADGPSLSAADFYSGTNDSFKGFVRIDSIYMDWG